MTFAEELKKISKDDNAEHMFFINCHYGYSIIEKINSLIEDFDDRGKVLLIYHGERNYKDIKDNYEGDYISMVSALTNMENDKRLTIVDAYGDLIRMRDGIATLSDDVKKFDYNAFDVVIFMNVNFITRGIIEAVEQQFYYTPIICIGDTETLISDSDVLNALTNTKYCHTDIYKMKGCNAEILHYIKKIRTGKINRIQRSTERDLLITMCDSIDDFFNMDEVMSYDVVIDVTGRHTEFNNNFRYQSGFDYVPSINEWMVNMTAFIVETSSGTKITVDAFNIFKVKSVDKTNGVLRIKTSFRDKDITIPINTHFLKNVTELEIPTDIIEHSSGVKMEFAYFIPPRVAANKSFSDVLIYFTNQQGSYIRLLLLTILMSCTRSFKIKTDYEYYL